MFDESRTQRESTQIGQDRPAINDVSWSINLIFAVCGHLRLKFPWKSCSINVTDNQEHLY